MSRLALVVGILCACALFDGSTQSAFFAARDGDYGYWMQPFFENATEFTLQRPMIAASPVSAASFVTYARINPTYNMTPAGNLSFGGGAPDVMARRFMVPWPYCLTRPWRVVAPTSQELEAFTMDQIVGFEESTPGASFFLGLASFLATSGPCATGRLLYGEDTIDFGTRSISCNRTLGPRCNETNTRTPFPCSPTQCQATTRILGAARADLILTEPADAGVVEGDIFALDRGGISRFKGVVTYEVPENCTAPVLLAIDGSLNQVAPTPTKVVQDGGQSAVFLQPAPSCGTDTRFSADVRYDPRVRAIPMCDQYVPVLPDHIVNRTVANATERAEWRRLHGLTGDETGPDNLRGFGRRVFMIIADALPEPLQVRVRVRWIGSAVHGFPNVTQPDVFVGFQRTVYVASPAWNDGFAYGLELTWFTPDAPPSQRGFAAFVPGVDRGGLPPCMCNTTLAPGNLACTINDTQIDLSGAGLQRTQISRVYNIDAALSTPRNTVVCGLVFGSFGTGPMRVASGVPFWAAAVGSTSTFGPLIYGWRLLDVPTAGGQLFQMTQFNITGIVTSISPFRLRVDVADSFLYQARCEVTITPISAEPIPRLTPPRATIQVGTFVLLDASTSETPAGDALSFSWSIIFPPTSAGMLVGDTSTGAIQFSSPSVGQFVVQVIVSNSFGDKGALSYITVTNGSLPGGPGSGTLPPSYGGDNGCFTQLPPVSFEFPPDANALPPFASGGGGGGGSPTSPQPPSVGGGAPVQAPEEALLLPVIPNEAFVAVVVVCVVAISAAAFITVCPSVTPKRRRD